MTLRAVAMSVLFLLLVSPAGWAGGKAGEVGMVTFHLETEAGENPKMVFPQMDGAKQRFFFRTPEITMKDVLAFRPFPSGKGEDFGLVLQLNEPATRRLNALSTANQGRYLLAQVNGRVVDGVIIDKPVNDGFIIIWKGITDADVKLFDGALPRIGEGKKKKKK